MSIRNTDLITAEEVKLWLSCPAKVVHYRNDLRMGTEQDAEFRNLTSSRASVERLALRLFPTAFYFEDNPDHYHRVMREVILQSECCILAPQLSVDGLAAKATAVRRRGNTIEVFKSYSKGADPRKAKEGRLFLTHEENVRSEWRDILLNLAFTTEVFQREFPAHKIVPHVLLPVEGRRIGKEEVTIGDDEPHLSMEDPELIEKRRRASILDFFLMDKPVSKVRTVIVRAIEELKSFRAGGSSPQPNLRYRCRNCEFRGSGAPSDLEGFRRCWGKLAEPNPHLFDLHQLYQVKDDGNALLADRLIAQGKTALADVTEEMLGDHPYMARQRMQLRGAQTGKEWVDPALAERVASLSTPVHFLDFETFFSVVPRYPGLSTYEIYPTQFSLHTIRSDVDLLHRDWLNTIDRLPTDEFAAELRAVLGDEGPVLVYTDYEVRVLRSAADQLERIFGLKEEADWIRDLLGSGRIVDQHEWLYAHYHNPRMGGRSSLKRAASAVWHESEFIREHRWFRGWGTASEDPYQRLQMVRLRNRNSVAVSDGVGAMLAYHDLINGEFPDSAERDAITFALKTYCQLDTLSQVMIFEHWRDSLSRG